MKPLRNSWVVCLALAGLVALAWAGPVRAGTGVVTVDCNVPAMVYLDGQLMGRTPLILERAPLGVHTLVAKAQGASQTRVLGITGADQINVEFGLPVSSKGPFSPLAYTHPQHGYTIMPPERWRLHPDARGVDLRLSSPDRGGIIDISSHELVGLAPQKWIDLYEKRLTGPEGLAELKLGGSWLPDAEPRQYRAVYQMKRAGVRAALSFLIYRDRIYLLMLLAKGERFEENLPVFGRLVSGFKPPNS